MNQDLGAVGADVLLSLTNMTKSFGAVRALRGAALEVRPGEVHVLFGENGAGKSTLINIIAGVFAADSGDMRLRGEPANFRSVHEARRNGIAAMFQEFSLAPALSVEQNLLLGNEPGQAGVISGAASRRMAREALGRFDFRIDLNAMTAELSRAEQQMVEMAKALLLDPKILILDEPTASLSERETELLFDTIRQLKAEGVAIIYITHRMREIDEIADRITVMRDGSYIACVEKGDVTHDDLIELMTGRQVGDLYPRIGHQPGGIALALRNVSTRDGRLKDISIELRGGEVVGLAGLVGCGKSEIGRSLFGLHRLSAGEIVLGDASIRAPTPRAMLRRGLCYITSDRRAEGLMMERSTRENIALSALTLSKFSAWGVLRQRAEKLHVEELAKQLHLRPLKLDTEVNIYSGGNQQKIVIARALARDARILVFDEPTVGVDVGARAEIYRVLAGLAEQGCCILLISSDMPEVLHLCHRIYVVNEGHVVDHLHASEASEQRLLQGFFAETEDTQKGTAKSMPKADETPQTNLMQWAKTLFIRFGILPLLLILVIGCFGYQEPRFLSAINLTNVARQSTFLVIVAMAQMLVLIVAGMDLSVGALIGLVTVVTGIVMKAQVAAGMDVGSAMALGIAAGLVTGLVVGAFNAICIAMIGLSPFITTLGTMTGLTGIALTVSGGVPVGGIPRQFAETFAIDRYLGLQMPIITMIALFVIGYAVLNHTVFGRYLYAVGSNARAARLSGISTQGVTFAAYVLCAFVSSIAGLLVLARTSTGGAGVGTEYGLQSVTACVIAGVSLFGGTGRIGGVVLGALFLALLGNGMNILQIQSYSQMIVLGGVLILALIGDRIRMRLVGQKS